MRIKYIGTTHYLSTEGGSVEYFRGVSHGSLGKRRESVVVKRVQREDCGEMTENEEG